MVNGNTNRRKGQRAEQQYARLFKQHGFIKCVTSRFGSRLHDNAKIDLINIPYNIQIKAGSQKNLNPAKELFMMKTYIEQLFEKDCPELKRPCLLIHRKDCKFHKRTEDLELVYMSIRQFNEFKKINPQLTFINKKISRLKINSEFKEICWLTFNDFMNKIVLYGKDNNRERDNRELL